MLQQEDLTMVVRLFIPGDKELMIVVPVLILIFVVDIE